MSRLLWTSRGLRALVALVAVGTLVLSACGAGNASTASATKTPGQVVIGHDGTIIPGVIKWGADSSGGMPYIVPADANNPKASGDPSKDYYGFEWDIANKMAALMQAQQQFVQITWSDWPQGLQSSQFDFFMNGLEITADNAQSAKFSIPYYVYTQSIVVLADNNTIHSFDDLAGKKVETGTGYKAEQILDDYNASHSTKIIKRTTDTPTPFNDLLSGAVDAFFLDTPIAKWYGSDDPSGKFKTVGGDMFPGYYAMGFNPANPNATVLIKEVNQAIAQMWLDGTLERIYKSGGAFNTSLTNSAIFEKYDLWNDSEACIGNFLPVNPTHVAGCPTPEVPVS